MNAFFFGTSEFAVPILTMLAARANVTVVTQPDRPAGRGHKLAATPVKKAAVALGLPVLTPLHLRAFAGDVRAAAPDWCVVASYGRIVPQVLLDAAPLWLNVHPSRLPLYRGATPIQSVIRDGRPDTAVSIIAMDAGMDTGDLLAQTPPIAIGPAETYGELHDRLAVSAAELLSSVLDADERGTITRTPQCERARELGIDDATIAATVTRPWTKDDRRVDRAATTSGAVDVVNLIRALTPAPGALVENVGLGTVRITRAHATRHSPLVDNALKPGCILANHGFIYLGATDGYVVIDEVQPAGKKPMSMRAWANGHALTSADVVFAEPIDELVAR